MRRVRPSVVSLAFAAAVPLAFCGTASAQSPSKTDVVTTGSLRGAIETTAQPSAKISENSQLRAVLDLVAKGDVAGADRLIPGLARRSDRAVAEWMLMRALGNSPGLARLRQFNAAYPDFPAAAWMRRKTEDALFLERARPEIVRAVMGTSSPLGATGLAALAFAELAANEPVAAGLNGLAAYRQKNVSRDVAERLAAAFPDLITKDEIVLRAHRLILTQQVGEGLRLAATFGPGHAALAQALAHADRKGASEAILAKVPAELQGHSSFLLAKAQVLRRLERFAEARDVFFQAPRDAALLAEPDAWWIERRMLARKLIAHGDNAGAYRIAAEHAARSPNLRADAEFHAGWIALRRLGFAQTALIHFDASVEHAVAANWKSRAAYWRGRALDAGAVGVGSADAAFDEAARWPTTFYGQLAVSRRGDAVLDLPAVHADEGAGQRLALSLAGQAIDTLLAIGDRQSASALAIELGRIETDAAVIDAVARPFMALGDAVTVSAIGRLAVERGLPLAHLSHPTFGIPAFKPLAGSGGRETIYAIAHQESAFRADAVSTANARGLMQMLPSTAGRTAARFKVPFSPALLTANPAQSAMLGAAHVGELLEETRGSLPLVFAAYNAGGGRVREWIALNGDPRKDGADLVDWIELVPIAETRHYIQKVMANLQVYRARFDRDSALLTLPEDLASGRR